jgi:hypothetical protein
MESSTRNRTARPRPGRFHRGRALAVTVLAAGTAVAALAPVTAAAGLTTPARGTICPSDRGPFDPAFGQPAASR